MDGNNEVSVQKVGRNDPCPCGSGNKFKKCCINEPAYNTPVTTTVAAPGKAAAVGAAAGRPSAAKNATFRGASAPHVAKTSTKRKV